MKLLQHHSVALRLTSRWLIAGLTIGIVTGLIELPARLGSLKEQLNQGLAQSGGRARGGSFDRPSSPQQAPSNSGSYSGGYSRGYDDSSSPYDYSRPYNYPSYPTRPDYFPGSYRRPNVIVVPPQSYPVPVDPGYGYGTSSSGDGLLLILLVMCGITILPVLMTYLKQTSRRSPSSGTDELTNDIVTVTQLQVALLAQARYIQEELTQLSLQSKLETQAGLTSFLQEAVLALLRSPENWSHARVSSQTVNSREQASQLFEQLSIQARSKLSAETLVNVGGQIRQQTIQASQNADPASYIVVTLLVGTADDRPLATSVHSAEELKAILQRLGGLSPGYLLIFELIWSPQDAADSLSYDQLLANYPDLVQI